MVLLYGIPGDGPFELVADALEARATPYVILNQRHFQQVDFILVTHTNGLKGELTIGADSYDLERFTGIYNRAVDFSVLPEAAAVSKTSNAYHQYATLFQRLNEWIEVAACRVVNKASAMSSNGSKPYQLRLIQPYFKVPPTLITNSPHRVAQFQQTHTEVIYKSASSVRSVVKTVREHDEGALQKIRHCPTLFQKRLQGVNFRVHVVGEQVFAVKIITESVDYRYSHREGNETELVPVQLANAVQQRCISLAKALQLPFAGIDLFETGDGEWYCFEVNPSPGFSYFEKQTNQPIADAIAYYLSGTATPD